MPSPRRLWLRAPVFLMPVLLALAGCLNTGADPTSTTVVYGDHATLTNCFIIRTKALISDIQTDPSKVQSITMTVNPSTETAYRVIFTDMPDNKTKVSGYPLGTTEIPFFWFSFVRPALKGCAGQLDVR